MNEAVITSPILALIHLRKRSVIVKVTRESNQEGSIRLRIGRSRARERIFAKHFISSFNPTYYVTGIVFDMD